MISPNKTDLEDMYACHLFRLPITLVSLDNMIFKRHARITNVCMEIMYGHG